MSLWLHRLDNAVVEYKLLELDHNTGLQYCQSSRLLGKHRLG